MTALYGRKVEDAALAWLENLGWTVKHGPEIVARAVGGAPRPRLAIGQPWSFHLADP